MNGRSGGGGIRGKWNDFFVFKGVMEVLMVVDDFIKFFVVLEWYGSIRIIFCV